MFVVLVLTCMNSLYALEINPLSVVSFAIIFNHSQHSLFTLFIVKPFNWVRLAYFCFYFYSSRMLDIEEIAIIYLIECSACFPLEFDNFWSYIKAFNPF